MRFVYSLSIIIRADSLNSVAELNRTTLSPMPVMVA